jgi:hypothetical protein
MVLFGLSAIGVAIIVCNCVRCALPPRFPFDEDNFRYTSMDRVAQALRLRKRVSVPLLTCERLLTTSAQRSVNTYPIPRWTLLNIFNHLQQ